MKNISILPVEYKQKQKSYKMISAYILLATIAIVIYIVAQAYFFVENINQKTELQIIQRENKKSEAQIASLESYKAAQEKIKDFGSLIVKAAGTNPNWKVMFNKVFEEMPENIQISEIISNYNGNSGEFIVKGIALENANVTAWISKIKSIQELKDVNYKLWTDDLHLLKYEIWAAISEGKLWNTNLEGGTQP